MRIRPIDVIGTLPELAAEELSKQTETPGSPLRMGALTFEVLDLAEVQAPTISERQASKGCSSLVLFFHRYAISENMGWARGYLDLTPLVRIFAKGCVLHHEVMVNFIGAFTDPQRVSVKWIRLPPKIDDWFCYPNKS